MYISDYPINSDEPFRFELKNTQQDLSSMSMFLNRKKGPSNIANIINGKTVPLSEINTSKSSLRLVIKVSQGDNTLFEDTRNIDSKNIDQHSLIVVDSTTWNQTIIVSEKVDFDIDYFWDYELETGDKGFLLINGNSCSIPILNK